MYMKVVVSTESSIAQPYDHLQSMYHRRTHDSLPHFHHLERVLRPWIGRSQCVVRRHLKVSEVWSGGSRVYFLNLNFINLMFF